jgi:hypothetical protein
MEKLTKNPSLLDYYRFYPHLFHFTVYHVIECCLTLDIHSIVKQVVNMYVNASLQMCVGLWDRLYLGRLDYRSCNAYFIQSDNLRSAVTLEENGHYCLLSMDTA